MNLKIKKSVIDGFNTLKDNPIVLLVGLIYGILVKLLEPGNLPIYDGANLRLFDSIYVEGINLTAIILLGIFINGLIIVLSAKGKKFSITAAVKLVASRYPTILFAYILTFIINALGLLAFVVPGIFLSIKLLYFEQAILLNGKGAVESLKMSWNVSRGNWWRVFALVLLISLISLMIVFPVNFFDRHIADFVASSLIVPFVAASYTKSYLQLKR